MKFASFLLLLVLLASCGAEQTIVKDTPQPTTTEVVEETNNQIATELESLDTSENTEALSLKEETETQWPNGINNNDQEVNTEVTKVQAVYKNPKQEVYIDMEYTLNDDGKIASIQMTDSNYNQQWLDENLQILVGKSIDEIDDTYIAGWSLTIPAVKKALTWE